MRDVIFHCIIMTCKTQLTMIMMTWQIYSSHVSRICIHSGQCRFHIKKCTRCVIVVPFTHTLTMAPSLGMSNMQIASWSDQHLTGRASGGGGGGYSVWNICVSSGSILNTLTLNGQKSYQKKKQARNGDKYANVCKTISFKVTNVLQFYSLGG